METVTKEKSAQVVSRLESLGFKQAAHDLKEKVTVAKKLMIAYEHYRYVRQEKIDSFNKELMKMTGKNMESMARMEYQTLAFKGIGEYENAPPESVLVNLEIAMGRECFDQYEVAYIKNVKDPLLFGRIKGCPDRFFIDQWDDDVKITDLIGPLEG